MTKEQRLELKHHMKFEQRTAPRTPVHGSEQYDNREIIAREPAMMTHPITNNQVYVSGATKVLLAPRHANNGDDSTQCDDGDIVYECVECGYVNNSVNGVLSHTQMHVNKQSKPLHELETIKLIVRLMRIEARTSHRGKAERVAEMLNDRGVLRRDGKPWSSPLVSSLYNRWKDKVRVRVPKDASSSIADDTPHLTSNDDMHADDRPLTSAPHNPSQSTHVIDVANDLVSSFQQVTDVVCNLADMLRSTTPAVDRLTRAITQQEHVSNDTVDKARRWDEMQKLFNK
jgi:hypothetical protein